MINTPWWFRFVPGLAAHLERLHQENDRLILKDARIQLEDRKLRAVAQMVYDSASPIVARPTDQAFLQLTITSQFVTDFRKQLATLKALIDA